MMKPKSEKKSVKKVTNIAHKKIENKIENQYLNSIKKLEIMFEEVLENHKRKIMANILGLNEEETTSKRLKNQGKLKKVTMMVESLKLKPSKGRAKDLLKIEKLINKLLLIFSEKEI